MLVHKPGYHRRSTRLSCLDSPTHTSLCAADDTPAYALVNLRNGISLHFGFAVSRRMVFGPGSSLMMEFL
jgi:hypothetical protein